LKAPGLKVAGTESPPFREPTDAELQALVAHLGEAEADLLWVGLGAPRQEKAMARLKRLGCPCVMVGVGAAFDYEAGLKPEAPAWMGTLGLEWAFRLVDEPGRLWKRYLSTNPRFMGLFLLEFFGLGRWKQGRVERVCRVAGLICALSAVAAGSPMARLCLLTAAGLALGEAAARHGVR
jgi:N-acetylglucosaminyldiphosphoundecaprenol N-acetyl-beta-D-mannosaminyltransferase